MITFVLSGPMRGIPDFNYPLFFEVEKALGEYLVSDGGVPTRDNGWKILNPARSFDGDQSRPIEDYMRESLSMVLQADYVVLLPGWEFSEGAIREIKAAEWTGKKFMRAYKSSAVLVKGYTWEFDAIDGSPTPQPPELSDDPPGEPMGRRRFKHESWMIPATTGRTFDTGAYRDTDVGKLNYEGFLSPLVLHRYAEYMHEHRVQSDGKVRSADNWQKGMSTNVYMESMWRHFMDVWMAHRNVERETPPQMDALMALLFNVMGYAFELLREPEGF